jgi:hypothetical protein
VADRLELFDTELHLFRPPEDGVKLGLERSAWGDSAPAAHYVHREFPEYGPVDAAAVRADYRSDGNTRLSDFGFGGAAHHILHSIQRPAACFASHADPHRAAYDPACVAAASGAGRGTLPAAQTDPAAAAVRHAAGYPVQQTADPAGAVERRAAFVLDCGAASTAGWRVPGLAVFLLLAARLA